MARILVIDDNHELRRMVRTVLEAAGHQVDEASDGKDGVHLYLRYGPDLVLCDMVMPGRDGFETIRTLRDHDPEARIVAMSGGSTTLSYLALAKKLGAFDSIAKPFTGEDLVKYVADLLKTAEPQ
jgi:two-component system, chemotaxis family, chemotaxis protein CheY